MEEARGTTRASLAMRTAPSPRVSVVMAAYQAEAFIAEAVQSVIAQTMPDWELVIVDDGSTDRTEEIARSFGDPRISVDRIDHVGVLAVVRNRAIAAGRAPNIAFLDADDVWYLRKLERQLCVLEDSEVGLVHCVADRLEGDRRVPSSARPPGATEFERLARDNDIVSSSVVVRRELLDMHGAFDPDPMLHGSLDYELWLRLIPYTVFARIDEPLLAYRVHARQMSADQAAMDRGAIAALEKARRRDHEGAAKLSRAIGILRCANGMRGRGRRDLLRAVWRDPTDTLAWAWLARAVVGTGPVRVAGRVLRRQRGSASS